MNPNLTDFACASFTCLCFSPAKKSNSRAILFCKNWQYCHFSTLIPRNTYLLFGIMNIRYGLYRSISNQVREIPRIPPTLGVSPGTPQWERWTCLRISARAPLYTAGPIFPVLPLLEDFFGPWQSWPSLLSLFFSPAGKLWLWYLFFFIIFPAPSLPIKTQLCRQHWYRKQLL